MENKELMESLVNLGSGVVGICGGVIVKKAIQTLPIDMSNVHPIVAKIGEYGLYSLTCFGVQKAVKADMMGWVAVASSCKDMAAAVKELKNSKKEEQNDEGGNTGLDELGAE